MTQFQSTPSVRRETSLDCDLLKSNTISIHSLRAEGDPQIKLILPSYSYFNPLPPCGGRPRSSCPFVSVTYFNPLPPCGGRHKSLWLLMRVTGISIHSLRAEGDVINVHIYLLLDIFQSTPSVRRETTMAANDNERNVISIHSLRAEGDSKIVQ